MANRLEVQGETATYKDGRFKHPDPFVEEWLNREADGVWPRSPVDGELYVFRRVAEIVGGIILEENEPQVFRSDRVY